MTIGLKCWIAVLAAVLGGAACSETPKLSNSDPLTASIDRQGDDMMASVSGSPVFRSDVVTETGVDAPSPAVFDQALERLIERRILALAALSRNLETSDTARKRVAVANERILASVMVQSHVDGRVTEAVAMQEFERQKAASGVDFTFEQKREEIMRVLTYKEVDTLLRTLREEADIKRYDSLETTADPDDGDKSGGEDADPDTPDNNTFDNDAPENEKDMP